MFSGRLFQCPTILSSIIIRRAKSRGKSCSAYLCLTQIYCNNFGPFTQEHNINIVLCYQRFYSSHDRESISKMAAPPDNKQKQHKHSNCLVNSKSPYLLQHAHNPVDWYPWGEEAFEKAHKEDKLIFLSVGYSTCHWCHVMERESFENEEIAKIMNEHFVNIKVDREERPDVDKVYMTFVQACSGGGGWPMSVFLKPDLKPISGGTYFPPEDNFGRPGFKTTLLKWARQWRENKAHWTRIGESVTEVIRNAAVFEVPMSENLISGQVPGEECWQLCTDQLMSHYEPSFGGFSLAPKFPQPCNLSYLLHVVSREPAAANSVPLTRMVTHTLTMMARGGIHDFIGQGFSRYSTDIQWHVPHFEKMLYDQAQLAAVYSAAYLLTKEPLFRQMVDDILTYVCRDLSHKEGGFYSAEDADSYPTAESAEKKEGAFCVWKHTEIKALLDKPVPGHPDLRISQLFCHHFGVQPQGNVDPHQDPHGELTGQNVLIETSSVAETAAKLGLGEEGASHALSEARNVLRAARSLRPKPHLDDKILTSWNGLMISGLARAGEALQEERYVTRAVQAAKFIQRHLYDDQTRRLLRTCYTDSATGGVQHLSPPIEGFLDDYAFVIAGLIDLYEACLDARWLEWAETLQTTQDQLFWDDGSAGYYSTPHHSNLILRLKEDQDGAEPSSNSVSCMNLLRLAAILDRAECRERAGQLLASFTSRLSNVPMALPHLTSALMLYHDLPTQVIVTGKAVEPDTAALLGVVRSRLVPGRVLLLADRDMTSILYRRSELLRRIKPPEVGASAYVCRHHSCSLPVTSAHDLAKLLDA